VPTDHGKKQSEKGFDMKTGPAFKPGDRVWFQIIEYPPREGATIVAIDEEEGDRWYVLSARKKDGAPWRVPVGSPWIVPFPEEGAL